MKKITSLLIVSLLYCTIGLFAAAAAGRGAGMVTPPRPPRPSDAEMIRKLDRQRCAERRADSARVAAERRVAMAGPAWARWIGRGPLFPVLPGSDGPDIKQI